MNEYKGFLFTLNIVKISTRAVEKQDTLCNNSPEMKGGSSSTSSSSWVSLAYSGM